MALTSLAPRKAARLSPDIPRDAVRYVVRYVWPAYRDVLTSLLEDGPLPAWLAAPSLPTTVVIAVDDQTVPADRLGAMLGPHVEAVRIPTACRWKVPPRSPKRSCSTGPHARRARCKWVLPQYLYIKEAP
jgi:hypothetical protein